MPEQESVGRCGYEPRPERIEREELTIPPAILKAYKSAYKTQTKKS